MPVMECFFFFQGKYSEAEPLYRQCLAIDENVYGKMHPEVSFDLNKLASPLKSQVNLLYPFFMFLLAS